jgi:signal transduction histidine kinase
MSANKEQKRKRKRYTTLALYVLPWWLIIPLGTLLLINQSYQQNLLEVEKKLAGDVYVQSNFLHQSLQKLIDDIRYIRDMTVAEYIKSDNTPDTRTKRLEDLYFSFGVAYTQYFQIRMIDTKGIEQIRIDRNVDGITINQDLQNKGNRFYVEQGQKLRTHEIYLTPMDLNVEKGLIEVPYRPTIRAVAPIYVGRERIGMVVLNLDGSAMLGHLRLTESLELINQDSYWLESRDPDKTWGFMFDNKTLRFDAEFPNEWQRMNQMTSIDDHFINDNGLWLIHKIDFETDPAVVESINWYLLAHKDDLLSLFWIAAKKYGPIGSVILILVSFFAYLLAKSRISLQQSRRLLIDQNQKVQDAYTNLQLAQDELVQKEKLSSLGLMVAGIAHELNTPLGSSMLCVRAMHDRVLEHQKGQRNPPANEQEWQLFLNYQIDGFKICERGLERAATLVKQFKQVAADRASMEQREFSLVREVHDVLALMKNLLKNTPHQLKIELQEEITMISYPGPVGQVVQNLVQNAMLHAYKDGNSGEIRLTTALVGDGEVLIQVEDDGMGISEEQKPYIFDPFYTTLKNQGGTGLGLNIVYHLVTQVLGGRIEVTDTHEGVAAHGARFSAYLPCVLPFDGEQAPDAHVNVEHPSKSILKGKGLDSEDEDDEDMDHAVSRSH